MASSKVLAKVNDRDFSDCVNTGYTWTLYSDGRVAAEYHSRWQGSTTGQRYTTDAGYVDVDKIDEDDPDFDAEALLTQAIQDVDPSEDRVFRQTRKGVTIR